MLATCTNYSLAQFNCGNVVLEIEAKNDVQFMGQFNSWAPTQNFLPDDGQHYAIPTVVHVMYEDENSPEFIGYDQICHAISEINYQLSLGSGSEETCIRLHLAQLDPEGNPTNGAVYVQTPIPSVTMQTEGVPPTIMTEIEFKNLSRWPVDKYLNIWIARCTTSEGDECDNPQNANWGFAPFPSDVEDPLRTGIVVRYDRFGSTGAALGNVYDVFIHEFGHYLGLFHVFGFVCTTDDVDGCIDTAPISPDLASCGVPSSCPPVGDVEPDDDFMGKWECADQFTLCQAGRMVEALEDTDLAFRYPLWQEANLINTGVLDTWSYISQTDAIQAELIGENCHTPGSPIQFSTANIDEYDDETSFSWDFGYGVTSNEAEPLISFDETQIVFVTLTIGNSSECSEVVLAMNFIVQCNCGIDWFLDTPFPLESDFIIPDGSNISGNIVVEDGGSLTIPAGALIRFSHSSRIIVKEGGSLYVGVGAQLTSLDNGCGEMWQGIEVWRRNWESNDYDVGGSVVIDGGIIQNAHVGIFSGKKNSNQEYSNTGTWTEAYSSGGEIQVRPGSKFIDCGIGVWFAALDDSEFPPFGPYTIPDNPSSIVQVSFTSEGGLMDELYNSANEGAYNGANSPHRAHANSLGRGSIGILSGQRVKGIEIFGNNFNNLEMGVVLMESHSDIISNSFTDLKYGVRVLNHSSHWFPYEPPLRIIGNDFDRIYDPSPDVDYEFNLDPNYDDWLQV
ncbi:MAG: PKD repeat protein [Flavobacteriales bacterium]